MQNGSYSPEKDGRTDGLNCVCVGRPLRFFGYAAGSVCYRGQLYLTLRRVYLLEYSNECEVVVTRAERRLWSSELHRSCGCLHFGGIAEFCNVGSTKLSSALVNHSWFAKFEDYGDVDRNEIPSRHVHSQWHGKCVQPCV